jgi:hypothetical protein
MYYICTRNTEQVWRRSLKIIIRNAKIAQLVERDLAKVEVAGSNPVFRSTTKNICLSGGIGRHAGLKIQWVVMPVRVQVPP